MINLDTVIDLINEKSEKFKAAKNKDFTGFALLYREGGTIAADVNEVSIPESLLERGNETIGYEIYYSSKCNKSFGGLGRLRVIDDNTISNETLIEFLENLIEFGDSTIVFNDIRAQMEDLLMRVTKIKKSIDEGSEDVDYLTFGNTSMYLVESMKKGIYYIWIGYDSHEDPDLDRTRYNFIIKCNEGRYLYRYSSEFFAKDNTSVGLELGEWIEIDLTELEKEIEQYIYISRYNTIG